jgi:hypothetical protein
VRNVRGNQRYIISEISVLSSLYAVPYRDCVIDKQFVSLEQISCLRMEREYVHNVTVSTSNTVNQMKTLEL